MVRSRSYDEDDVLTRAMHAFRREGYARISIPQLEAATGLSSGSIYNSFGDKRGIFLAAFEHYLHSVLERRIAQFAKPENGLVGVRQLFLSLLREPDGETFGCLITNSAIEFGADNDAAESAIVKGFAILERLFADRLAAAVSSGQLPKRFDPKAGSVRLLALYQGVLVLVRGGYDLKAIRRAINQEFDHLEGEIS
ncbi:TetR/AcrR family transcriptional regulator [Bradyrhizobium sp.]|uniref:TetR/AcrR family transcriptional regulator n=1 Tax=Bradyrhizobium sp. TaxID=376 RepID=UPI002D2EC628|nr:TetR/AcrR family transcriptional regulator [Bradyrhizobium sp.]HZR75717.1 TetR/AcrR family transcriptional regulator [Bradyrhizobium sp.]